LPREIEPLKKLKNNETGSADEVIKKYYPDILRYCLWRIKNKQTAEDATQETFLKWFRHLDRYRNIGKPRALLYKIAANTCTDMLRKKHAEPLPENMAIADEGFDSVDSKDRFLRIIEGLPGEQKEAVMLRFGHDLKMREIAEVTGLPLRTVQSRLRAATKSLKAALEKGGGECEDIF